MKTCLVMNLSLLNKSLNKHSLRKNALLTSFYGLDCSLAAQLQSKQHVNKPTNVPLVWLHAGVVLTLSTTNNMLSAHDREAAARVSVLTNTVAACQPLSGKHRQRQAPPAGWHERRFCYLPTDQLLPFNNKKILTGQLKTQGNPFRRFKRFYLKLHASSRGHRR